MCFDEPVCSTCHYFIFPFLNEQDFETEDKGDNQRINIWDSNSLTSDDSKQSTNIDPAVINDQVRNYDEV